MAEDVEKSEYVVYDKRIVIDDVQSPKHTCA